MRRVDVLNILLGLGCLGLVVPDLIILCPFLVGVDYSLIVASRSMYGIYVGDIVLVKRVDPPEIQLADVVSYRFHNKIITHRVIDTKEGLFQMKGDTNQEPDFDWVEPSQILGRVCSVVPLSFISSLYGFGLLFLTPSAVLIIKVIHRLKREMEILDTTNLLLLAIITLSVTNTFIL